MQLVHFPKIGLATESAVVREMLKHVGDSVQIGDALMTVETEKATVDVQSSAAGRIVRLLVSVDQHIPPGTALAVVSQSGLPVDEQRLAAMLQADGADGGEGGHPLAGGPASLGTAPAPTVAGGAKATPLVRRRAAQLGIPLEAVKGSGPGNL